MPPAELIEQHPAGDGVRLRAARAAPAAGVGERQEDARPGPAHPEPRLRHAARIADHLDSLTAGDESNAVLEALDAVNLMTVHASKGLEFPIVFVVNLARGASGPPRPVRVIVDGEGGEPSVSVGPFVSETDEAERDREKQETRRLLYVALTRARDRLYLRRLEGRCAAGRAAAASPKCCPTRSSSCSGARRRRSTNSRSLGWTGQSGRAFEWRICRVPETVVTVAASGSPGSRNAAGRRPISGPCVDAANAGRCDSRSRSG